MALSNIFHCRISSLLPLLASLVLLWKVAVVSTVPKFSFCLSTGVPRHSAGGVGTYRFIYLIHPVWAYRKQHAHSDVIVKQYNIMSTQVVSVAVISGRNGESWEYRSQCTHGSNGSRYTITLTIYTSVNIFYSTRIVFRKWLRFYLWIYLTGPWIHNPDYKY